MKKISALLFGVLAAATLVASDLLVTSDWSFTSYNGGEGAMQKNLEGGYELNKTNDPGAMIFSRHIGFPVEPGKSYRVSCEINTSSGLQASLIAFLPRQPKPRSPWPSGNGVTGSDKCAKVYLNFTAQEGESVAYIRLVLRGRGKTVVSKMEIAEVKITDNLVTDPSRSWRVSKALGAECNFTQLAAGTYEIVKSNDAGHLVVLPTQSFTITPGKQYHVTIRAKRESVDVRYSLMVNMPDSKRTPYPVVASKGVIGTFEEISYVFTANNDEKQLNICLVINGIGTVILDCATLKEISEKEKKKLEEGKKVTRHHFDATALREAWTPIQIKKEQHSSLFEFDNLGNGGIECKNLNWNAADIKALELRAAFWDEPGYLRLDFVAEYDNKRYSSYLSSSGCAAGEVQDFYFPVGDNPAWRGTIKEIKIVWLGQPGKMGFAALNALKENNIIPFADEVVKKEGKLIRYIRPRGKYILSWKYGVNPGCTIIFSDRKGKALSNVTLSAGESEMAVVAPELTASAELLVNAKEKTGYPVLTLKNIPNLGLPVPYWRGSWIWCRNDWGPNNTNVWFQREINLHSAPSEAAIVIAADDEYELFVNGQRLGAGRDWSVPARYEITKLLKAGKNNVIARVHNVGAWGGLLAEIFAMVDNNATFFPSDANWNFHIGGQSIPATFDSQAMVLGTPPIPPWNSRIDYKYVGPAGELELINSNHASFTAKVLHAPEIATSQLYFLARYPDNSSRSIKGTISPDTSMWKKDSTITVKYQLPPEYIADATLYLDTDYLKIKGNKPLGVNPKQPKPESSLASAKIIDAGGRPFFEINGKNYAPIYYDLPVGFMTSPDSRSDLIRNAVAGGVQVIRMPIAFDNIWPSEKVFDFSPIDRMMETATLNAPQLPVILHVKLGMPKWWCDANFDDTTRYDNDQPIHEYKDRQSLASKKWLTDASATLRKVITHIKNSPYSNRIFAIGIAEGWNSEWFWPYADQFNQPARSGYSHADYETFRIFLRERYQTDAALTKAWNQPGTTFENFTMPSPKEQDSASALALLDPQKDMKIIDYFHFRNRAVGDAINTFGKVVKEETGGKWLVGTYYGYFVACSHIYFRLQTVGHLDIEKLAHSHYVDMVWAPSFYHWRRLGMGDGVMQPAATFSLHNKLVIVEQDMRTFSEADHYEAGNGRTNTIEHTFGTMNRAFGMLLAQGLGTHWMEMNECWFREPVLLDLMNEQIKTYCSLPPVAGTTPCEVYIISDQESAFYAKHNMVDGSHRGTIAELMRRFCEVGVPFKHLFLCDLLQENSPPPPKLYIVTNLLMLSDSARKALMARFEQEKATVLWLYAAGVSYPDSGPSADNMSELLGLKFEQINKMMQPSVKLLPGWGVPEFANLVNSGPWFFSTGGFDECFGKTADSKNALVMWRKSGVTHYFSSLMNPPPPLLRAIAKRAGVHIYNDRCGDPLWVGNDVVFLHAKTGGEKSILLPIGTQMRGIAGPVTGVLTSGQKWQASPGMTYGFWVEKK